MRTTWESLLNSQTNIVADGGMGTMLQAHGLKRGGPSEIWNVERPEVVDAIHSAYISAGAQIILTNSFGGTRVRLGAHGLAGRTAELNRAAARLARTAADRADHPVLVAGSMGPTGMLLAPLGDLEFDDAVEVFREQAAALVEGGVDLLWIETMSDPEEVRAALEACQQAAPDVPRVATMTFDTHGRTMMGVTPAKALELIRGWGVVALGANCGNGPDELERVIEAMRRVDPETILIAKANAGLPHMEGETVTYDATPAVMAQYALHVRDLGARIIGSCCGSTPDHIAAISEVLHST